MHYYLVINEGISNGLIKSQIINPIEYNHFEDDVYLISIEKPFAKKAVFFSKLKTFQWRIGIPYKLFLFNRLAHFLVPVLAFLYAFLLSFILQKKDYLIARSYFPGLVAFFLYKFWGIGYKFDPRSLFVHESVTKGLINENSYLFRKWLNWEKKILTHAEKIIVVSRMQGEYYSKIINSSDRIIYIPCYAEPYKVESESFSRTLIPFSEEDIVIVYYGSLDNGWNNKEMYLPIFQKAINLGYKVCIISQNHKQLRSDQRFLNRDIFILDTDKHTDFGKYMRQCDYGIILMPKTKDWETRLGVKFVEYLNNGLGVLVGEFVGEAAAISTMYFKNYSHIIRENDKFPKLVQINLEGKMSIIKKASEMFYPHNFQKVLF